MAQEIKGSDLSKTIGKILSDYRDNAKITVQEAVKKVARAGARELQARSAQLFNSKDGHYAKGWRANVDADSHGATGTIYNKNAPGLVHLLENGHLMRNGARSKAYPHVAPVEQQIVAEFESEVEKGL